LFWLPGYCHADLYIIVNKNNSLTEIGSDQVGRIYMLKSRRFENGVNVEPIAQGEGTKGRETFNRKVLQRTEQQLRYYWARRMFAGGERPPPVGINEAEVETYVADHEGGIGYITMKPKDPDVKILKIVKE
jgi:hypothetical protein